MSSVPAFNIDSCDTAYPTWGKFTDKYCVAQFVQSPGLYVKSILWNNKSSPTKAFVTPKKWRCRYQSCTWLQYVPVIAIPIPVVLISIPVFSKSMISIQIPVASDSDSDSCVPKSFDFNLDSDSRCIMWLQFQFFFQISWFQFQWHWTWLQFHSFL